MKHEEKKIIPVTMIMLQLCYITSSNFVYGLCMPTPVCLNAVTLYIWINRTPGFLKGHTFIAFILVNPNMPDPKITKFDQLVLSNF